MIRLFRSYCLPIMLLCSMLSVVYPAGAIVRQWGEAAGFAEFGIAASSIVLEAQDTLATAVRIDIGAGDFVAAAHADAPHTRPWGITLTGTNTAGEQVSVTFLSAVLDTVLAFDELQSRRVIMVRQTTGNHTTTSVISCDGGFLKRFPTALSMVVERRGAVWTVTLRPDNGKAESYTPMITEGGFAVESFGITVPARLPHRKGGFGRRPSNRVEIHRATVQYTPAPPMAAITSVDALTSYFLRSTDPIEGYYRISERSFDEQYLRPGGDYVLAMLRCTDGSYDIIYISGATQLPSAWKTGMVHGRAIPTANPLQYAMTWIDARYRPIASEGLMTVDGEGLVTLQFPYLSSTVRLQRLDPAAVRP